MGIHLPFVGYVTGKGSERTRILRTGAYNSESLKQIEEFLGMMRAVPHDVLAGYVNIKINKNSFREVLFEEDEINRPVLQEFLNRRRKGTLVIPSISHLFTRHHNDIVDEFASHARSSLIPIVALDEAQFTLSPGIVKLLGDQLPMQIMNNQIENLKSIQKRFSMMNVRAA